MEDKYFEARFDEEGSCIFNINGLDLNTMAYICGHILKVLEDNSGISQINWAERIIETNKNITEEE